MNLAQLTQQLEGENQHPPVEKWHPPFCGDMDIRIKADGTWLYMGTPIGRQSLVKLFASVLCKQDEQYFLVTPVEKVRIVVEECPFVITSWQQHPSEQGQIISFESNVGDSFVLSDKHPLQLPTPQQKGPLYLDIHRNMQAVIHRNVYYQLAEIATLDTQQGKQYAILQSAQQSYRIGCLDE